MKACPTIGVRIVSIVACLVVASSLPVAQRLKTGAAPTLSTSLQTSAARPYEIRRGGEVRFTVTASQPGGRVSLSIQNPPPGLVFDPLVDVPSPAVAEVRWRPGYWVGGRHDLVFRATSAQIARELVVPLRVPSDGSGDEAGPGAILVGDVTGDGTPDLVGRAALADRGFVADTGALYVWAGGQAPSGTPSATLEVPSATWNDRLGFTQLVDVTADGVRDVVVLSSTFGGNVGAIFVWAGGAGLSGSVAPSATLAVPGAPAGARLGDFNAIWISDLTGDGLPDVVTQGSGEIFVFAGGGGLIGAQAPSATLRAPPGVGVRVHTLADVTGDGELDVVGLNWGAPGPGGEIEIGALFVFGGGPALTGIVAPTATLQVPGAQPFDHLGMSGVDVIDLGGDGILDLLAGSRDADADGLANNGALYVFTGGAGLTGAVGPSATLTVPGGQNGDSFAWLWSCDDVDGDGLTDVIAPAPDTDVGGAANAGVVHVFAGGPALSGSVSPSATLVPPAAAGDRAGFGVETGDVTGDGLHDVILFSAQGDVGGVSNAGAVYLWLGGASLSGTLAPHAVLHSATPTASLSGMSAARLDDLDHDGTLDIVATMPSENALHLWKGGGALTGVSFPSASLHPTVPASLGGSYLVLVGDVIGDGHADVVALGTSDGSTPVGLVFDGSAVSGASLAPVVLAGAQASASGVGLQLVDLDADGRLDVVSGDSDRVRVFTGGTLAGTVTPHASLVASGTVAADQVGVALGQGILFADLTGDGRTDIVAGARYEDVGGVHDAGGLHVWRGGASLAGTRAPLVNASVPGAKADDQLGY